MSHDRILTSHVGALPRPPGLPGLAPTAADAPPVDVARAVDEVVAHQRACGLDIVNDGEFGKISFLHYVRDRLSNMTTRPLRPGELHSADAVALRDMQRFPAYFQARGGAFGRGRAVYECTGPVRYTGQSAIATDVRHLRQALQANGASQGFLTSISPLTVSLAMPSLHHRNEEEYRIELADALREEYHAIVDGGFMLQIDDPGFAHAWQAHPEWTLDDCRAWCAHGVELVNYALRDLPPDRVRFHMCWGSYHGPHVVDVELHNLIDLLVRINVSCYSIEGGNARHEHEWQVFSDFKLPEGKSLMPGVVSHATDTVEHPELVAQRLMRFAEGVGRERIVAGTDCGMMRVHPEICWAKLEALSAGARLASQRLWRRAA
jgi:5-methyltetrahydropteroyltriglutamate--homocysteine methyltransferase